MRRRDLNTNEILFIHTKTEALSGNCETGFDLKHHTDPLTWKRCLKIERIWRVQAHVTHATEICLAGEDECAQICPVTLWAEEEPEDVTRLHAVRGETWRSLIMTALTGFVETTEVAISFSHSPPTRLSSHPSTHTSPSPPDTSF